MANNPHFDFTPTLSSSYSHSSSSSSRALQSADNNPYFEFQGSSSSSSYHRSPPGGSRRSSASSGGQRRYRTSSPVNTFHGPPPASTTGNGGWREIERVAGSDSTHQQDKTALGDALLEGSKHGGPQSVCVLDTNTLVHAAAFFESLFRLLLQGMANASSPISSSSSSTSSGRHSNPFVLVIPHFVLEELDALKVRPSVGPQARKANHILLRALEAQQRLARQLRQREDGQGRSSSPKNSGEELPRSRLCILVEKAQEALPRSARSTGWSVDVALVSLCHTLQRQTGLPVVFCSNDTNARTRAEIEGVQTFDLGAVLRASARVRAKERSKVRRVSGGDRSSAASIWSGSGRRGSDGDERAVEGRIGEASCPDEAPEMLLEQWAVQIGGGTTGDDAGCDGKDEADSARVLGEQALPSLRVSNGYSTALTQPSTEDDGMDMDLDAQAAAPHQEHTHQPQDAVTKRTRLSTSDPPTGTTDHFPASTNQLADLPPSADVELNPTFHWPSGGTTSWSGNSSAKASSQRQLRPLPKSVEARQTTSDGRTANGGALAS
ncbi:hypothetical protein BDZ90DRAFT_140560 [Jaminaea rosea]|uniref:PIN domain-containing protein n=1 Tax=Jaminaea rosea TaxID=1569628 RepID=A0A316UWK0_9BASI|nr:hypothetical protein BDZ90DRAFT_140560 [Jaminaea rosea]PWN29178.1 hypothetical protein BDZ90DRAFT_140560 [Jaminaea rosea]